MTALGIGLLLLGLVVVGMGLREHAHHPAGVQQPEGGHVGGHVLGLVVVGMGLLDRRWGNAGWRVRFLTGLAVAGGGLYFLLRR